MKKLRQIVLSVLLIISILGVGHHEPHIHDNPTTKIIMMIKEKKNKEY